MTLTMSLPQSGKAVHGDHEWWWLFPRIAPVFVKEQMIKYPFSRWAARQGHPDEHHTYKGAVDSGVLEEAGGRQVLDMSFPRVLSGFLLDFIL